MQASTHCAVTSKAFSLLYRSGRRSLNKLKQTVVEEAGKVDNYKDLEFVDVDSWLKTSGGRDDPHVKKSEDDDDVPRYEYKGQIYSAFNHFIDIKKGPGLFDDYDGYSYKRGSACKDEYQDVDDVKKDVIISLYTRLTGNRKVDDALNHWFNDEYVHALGQKWYRGCSPSIERYSFPADKAVYGSVEAELRARFPLADPKGKKGKGISL